MKIPCDLQLKLDYALEKLMIRHQELLKLPEYLLGSAFAPRPADYIEDDPLIGELNPDWYGQIQAANQPVDAIISEILAQAPRTAPDKLALLDSDKVWVWGGPTPYWGGSMADDTLVRGADFFQARNVVYVYGPTTEKMLGLHRKYSRMLCQVNSNCRTPGALTNNSEEANAEELSRLSLQYPNVVGAMCDDFSTSFRYALLPERFEKIYRGVKKHNSALQVYGVIYVHELGRIRYRLVQEFIDVVNLWHWHKEEILNIEENLEKCEENFPGKPIILGVFLHEYGRSDIGTPPDLLCYQLEKAREFLAQKRIEGIIILGDREIKKWPASANAVRDYLASQA